ncbi:hypothetical protein [Luteipulveratus halotolerans]|uniref:Uncharacterized protein n=1 Tax=Luteipulveratus halotolerans TaxID=1631356 RepID=A0A0L6CEM2_9MICO|nr:hypothetical protein [Luteipulveratus halotolerans]KNX36015.1 hypothetical protein VV01_00760 [Luteipulveratus halotolerans]
MSNHDLERLLTEAFDAQASQVTPDQLDTEREHVVRRQLAEPVPLHRRDRRGFFIAGAGLAAAALVVGAVVVTQQPHGTAELAGQSTSASRSTDPALTASTSPLQTDVPSTAAATTVVPPPSSATADPDLPSGRSDRTTRTPSTATATSGALTSSGPLSVPATFVAEGERSSIPMPPGLTYEIVSSGPSSVQVRVSDFMQLARYLDNNSPLASWPRDGGGYHSPASSMAASIPAAEGDGSTGTFSLFADSSEPTATEQPTATDEPTGPTEPTQSPTTTSAPTTEPTGTTTSPPTSDGGGSDQTASGSADGGAPPAQ